MLDLLLDPQIWMAFATLTALELVLGIDNILFISILVAKLAPAQRETARRLGLFLALFMRVGLLLGLSWIIGLAHADSGWRRRLPDLEKRQRNPRHAGR
jgi:predicted tellurium resistance membrane protein TerC